MTKPDEPTLTCSEVVERLATECLANYLVGTFDRKQAEQILHSWRDRRVQELEEALRSALRDHVYWPERKPCPERCKHEGCRLKRKAEEALANSEQIRKGAKHD